jgi:large subunit ribosomal protein L24
MKIKVNDKVEVMVGKDKGKQAKVTSVVDAQRVIVEGVNKFKRHVKKQNDNPGGIVEIERAMDVSKVQLICPSCKKITRIGYQVDKSGKIRVCKKCQASIDK